MTGEEKDSLAAEYVLGTLDEESRARVDFQLLDDPDMRQAVEAWEQRLTPLAEDTLPVPPPSGLWDKIEASLDKAPRVPYAVTVAADQGEWIPVVEGVEKKSLFVDAALGTESFLLRLAPGAAVPAHAHAVTEECVMLEGEMRIGDLLLRAGDFHAVSAGASHPVIFSETGGLLYVRGEIRD